MKNPTCVFKFVNSGKSELLLYLEPEGAEFPLPAGEAVQVHTFGSDHPIEIKCSAHADGRPRISFWPDNGDFEVFFKGKNVWDHL